MRWPHINFQRLLAKEDSAHSIIWTFESETLMSGNCNKRSAGPLWPRCGQRLCHQLAHTWKFCFPSHTNTLNYTRLQIIKTIILLKGHFVTPSTCWAHTCTEANGPIVVWVLWAALGEPHWAALVLQPHSTAASPACQKTRAEDLPHLF